jgi:signal peptidase I
MTPSIYPGEYFLYERKCTLISNYLRGDVVVIKTSRSDQRTIKRVIGIEKDLVQIIGAKTLVNDKVIVTRDGYFESQNQQKQQWKVGVGELFVMGDNFQDSIDSRRYGPINLNLVQGRAWLRVWPLNLIGKKF